MACYLGLELGGIKIKRFADGEIYVQVLVSTGRMKSLHRAPCRVKCGGGGFDGGCQHLQESIRGCDVFLIQPTCPPVNDHLMELMVMIDACKRASARSITAVSLSHRALTARNAVQRLQRSHSCGTKGEGLEDVQAQPSCFTSVAQH